MDKFVNKLQKTPRWEYFNQWYLESYFSLSVRFESWYCGGNPESGFCDLPFEFQKGIFEKFIISHAWTNNGKSYPFFISQRNSLSSPKLANFCLYDIGVRYFETMEGLVLYFFNDNSPEIELV